MKYSFPKQSYKKIKKKTGSDLTYKKSHKIAEVRRH
jgi:hypothetical protein